MKKIALLTPTFSYFSGMDRLAKLQAEEFIANGNEVLIITFQGDIEIKGAKIIKLGESRNSFVQKAHRLFFPLDRKIIKKCLKILKGYDQVISYLYPMSVIAAEAKKRYGIEFTYYDVGVADAKYFDTLYEKCYMLIFNRLTLNYAKFADRLISISKFAKGILEKELVSEKHKMEYKYPPKMKIKHFKQSELRSIKEKLNLHFPVYLYVGRLSPHKGVDKLIEAFKKVEVTVPASRLIIVGKETVPKYMRKLKKMSSERVIFTGYVPEKEIDKYYNLADVYVSASKWECYDIPAVEAERMEKPVVVFDIQVHKELLKSKKSRLVPMGDVTAFAKEMEAFAFTKTL
ncbi:glycosyltransferase family 4 protein [Candidatus Woesearchaeota archaeon]|nr:glycosyltransferase family 4 protein [Candidatus Woesearchaeota archaeon]